MCLFPFFVLVSEGRAVAAPMVQKVFAEYFRKKEERVPTQVAGIAIDPKLFDVRGAEDFDHAYDLDHADDFVHGHAEEVVQ